VFSWSLLTHRCSWSLEPTDDNNSERAENYYRRGGAERSRRKPGAVGNPWGLPTTATPGIGQPSRAVASSLPTRLRKQSEPPPSIPPPSEQSPSCPLTCGGGQLCDCRSGCRRYLRGVRMPTRCHNYDTGNTWRRRATCPFDGDFPACLNGRSLEILFRR
jgi:hypothetical protein